MNKCIVGIDPGVSNGAVALLEKSSILSTWTLEKDPSGGLDLKALCKLINVIQDLYEPLWVLEEIHSIFGTAAGSMFAMARGLGNIEAALQCNGCDFKMVKPKEWQSKIWISEDIVYKDSSAKRKVKDTKATSLAAIKRLYPQESTKLMYGENEKISGRRTKFHDGICDAVLIARSQINMRKCVVDEQERADSDWIQGDNLLGG